MPLHAEAAAVQANREINTIGWGSLAAVLLLVGQPGWGGIDPAAEARTRGVDARVLDGGLAAWRSAGCRPSGPPMSSRLI